MSCDWCDGSCEGADLDPLVSPELAWLWSQVARTADRRGDQHMVTGTVTLRIPDSADDRAAAVGLLGGQTIRAGQTRRLELAQLAQRVRIRGQRLTPGSVAAHATHRRLAARAHAAAARAAASDALRVILEKHLGSLPGHICDRVQPSSAWARLQRSGWVARLLDEADSVALVVAACSVLEQLPDGAGRVDRRTLVPGNPHALDDGQTLAALVLALADVGSVRTRTAWGGLGVDCDDLVGGLIALGLRPNGWSMPPDAVVTIPPRELARVRWQPPLSPGDWAFVTENPSILAAASVVAADAGGPGANGAVHLLCTAGTPSDIETAAVGALSDVGWRVAVRADFDAAGLAHVRALLAAAPRSTTWRMDAADYLASSPDGAGLPVDERATPWDPSLAKAMTASGAPAYEEDLLPELLADLRAGRPRSR